MSELLQTVFLDLEGTVIEDWSEMLFLPGNIEKIKARFPQGIQRLGLMSWAVWDQRDLDIFNTRLRPHLEDALGSKFDDTLVWSMDSWKRVMWGVLGKKIDTEDMFELFGKEHFLMAFAKSSLFQGWEVFLIDDRISNMELTVMNHDNTRVHSKVNFLNIFNL